MRQIIQCIPNFSEGKDKKKIKQIIKAITNVSDIFLLDHNADKAHNRCVITFAGEPEKVIESAFQATKKAADIIDLSKHKGEHPRMGATDVIPLVPIKGISKKECIDYAKKLGNRIATELKIPVYLYEQAAQQPNRKNLANIRNGEYEKIKKEIGKIPERDPDFGPKKLGKAGATAIGVREALIAYNVNLNTDKLEIAKAIAKKIRESSGGMKFVKALGFEVPDRKIVQVSMNLTNYKITPPHQVFKAIKKECQKHNIKILDSEIIGLIPEDAFLETAKYYLKISPDFKKEQILEIALRSRMETEGLKKRPENIIQEEFHNKKSPTLTEKSSTLTEKSPTLTDFLNSLASKSPTPGGGSVSALAGSLAAGLLSMVANLTLSSKKYSKVHKQIQPILKKTESLRKKLYHLIEEDAQAYQKVISAYKLPESKTKTQALQKALKYAAQVPLKTAQTASALIPYLKFLAAKGNKTAISDCGVALHFLETAIKGAILNIKINLKYIKDKGFINKITGNYEKIRKSAKANLKSIQIL